MGEAIDAEIAARFSGEAKQHANFALRVAEEVYEILRYVHIVPDEVPTLEQFSPVYERSWR